MTGENENPYSGESTATNNAVLVPDNVREAMVEYHSVFATFKTAEARLEALKPIIKNYMNDTKTKNFKQFGKTFELQTQDRSKMDEDKAVEILKNLGLTECIVTKELPDADKVKKAIADGKLEMEQLAGAVKPNIILVLQYKDDKNSGAKEGI